MSKKILSKIKKNELQIAKLLNENIDLKYDLRLGKFERFSEKTQNINSRRNPEMVKLKIGHYFQYSKGEIDRDNKSVIKIERSEIVEINGQKCDEWKNPLEYYNTQKPI